MEKTYAKKDDLTMTITTTEQKTEAEDITLKDLLQRKANVLGEIQRIDDEYKRNKQVKMDKLAEIETLIAKAKDLGIEETSE